MPKLCQIVAIVGGKKSKIAGELTRLHHSVQRSDLIDGFTRTYNSDNDEGEQLPNETKKVQMTVKDILGRASKVWADVIDCVATQDAGNCEAKADITVDGKVVARDVPVTHLLFLEKQLTDIGTFVEKLPVLDPAENWKWDTARECYATEPVQTVKTRKQPKVITLAQATDKHPAQAQLVNEDVRVGLWSTTKFSGALPAGEKRTILDRLEKLKVAVLSAREGANTIEVESRNLGEELFNYLIGS